MEHYLTTNQSNLNKARKYKLIYNKVKEKCIYTENSETKIITV